MNQNPIDLILAELDGAIKSRLYYAAIVLALTLPDVCAALETSGGDTSGRNKELYVKWFDNHLAARFTLFTGLDLYRLRCGGLHQGRFGHDKMQYDRAVFFLPNPDGGSIVFQDGSRIGTPPNQVAVFSADVFCQDIANAVRSWFSSVVEDTTVKENLARLICYRQSYPPAIQGSYPMIA